MALMLCTTQDVKKVGKPHHGHRNQKWTRLPLLERGVRRRGDVAHRALCCMLMRTAGSWKHCQGEEEEEEEGGGGQKSWEWWPSGAGRAFRGHAGIVAQSHCGCMRGGAAGTRHGLTSGLSWAAK